jgi:large subunit ribosomal protein L4
MIEAPHYTAAGARRATGFALPAEYFDGTVNEPVLHQAVRAFLNNQRQGTAQTKTRSFVSGGNQKPWRQKGTGRARQGSIRAPQWRHGGIVFGPHPRSYRLGIPKKIRQLAKKSALNARAREQAVFVVDPLAYDKPKTKPLAELLAKLGLDERKVLVLTAGQEPQAHNIYLSGRNLPGVRVMRFVDATAYEILWADAVVIETTALEGAAAERGKDGEDEAAEETAGEGEKADA